MSPRTVIPPGHCTRCYARPARPQRKTCDRCAASIKRTNARRRAMKREWDRTDKARADANRRKRARLRNRIEAEHGHRLTQVDIARLAEQRLERWARLHGRIPTLRESADITGYTVVAVQFRRRAAFNLRPLAPAERFGRIGAIPYPVPAEYLAPAASSEDDGMRQ